MITILHGDNTSKSREELVALKSRLVGQEIIELPGTLTLTDFKQAMESQSLFAEKRTVIIENFFSKRGQKKNDDVLTYLAKAPHEIDVIIWEGKQIDGRKLLSFKKADIRAFKYDATMFQFLDSLRPGNARAMIQLFHQTIQREAEDLVFFMLVRQTRLMFALSVDAAIAETTKMAPWQRSKVAGQARSFSPHQLQTLIQNLHGIDFARKRGKSALSLVQQLDILLARL